MAGVHYLPAAILANQFAVVWNFLLTEQAAVPRPPTPDACSGRFGRFALLGNVDLVLRIPLLALLVGGSGSATSPRPCSRSGHDLRCGSSSWTAWSTSAPATYAAGWTR